MELEHREPLTQKVMKKVYLSGPMTGYENHNFSEFDRMTEKLEAFGYEVVNPASLSVDFNIENPTRQDYYRKDIRALTYCDTILMLEGWERSHGAQFERYVALELGLFIVYEEELYQ